MTHFPFEMVKWSPFFWGYSFILAGGVVPSQVRGENLTVTPLRGLNVAVISPVAWFLHTCFSRVGGTRMSQEVSKWITNGYKWVITPIYSIYK